MQVKRKSKWKKVKESEEINGSCDFFYFHSCEW
jgi:hypothetical protein